MEAIYFFANSAKTGLQFHGATDGLEIQTESEALAELLTEFVSENDFLSFNPVDGSIYDFDRDEVVFRPGFKMANLGFAVVYARFESSLTEKEKALVPNFFLDQTEPTPGPF